MRWRVLLLLALLVAAGWWGLNILLRPEILGAWLVSIIEQRTDLQVKVSAPARLDLFGGLRVAMDGLELRLRGAERTVLRADSLRVALDWSSLWGAPSIRRIELQRPHLDVAALQAWLDSRAGEDRQATSTEPFPRFGAVQLEDGTVEFGAQRIEELDAMMSAHPSSDSSTLNAAMLYRFEGGAEPLRINLAADSVRVDGVLRVEGIGLTAVLGKGTLITAEGRLDLDAAGIGAATFDTGAIAWPVAWLGAAPEWSTPFSAVPLQFRWSNQGEARRSVVRVTSRSPDGGEASDSSQSESDDVRLEAEADPGALIAWWQAGLWWQPPPLRVLMDAPRIESDGVVIEGLRLQATPGSRIEDPAAEAARSEAGGSLGGNP